MMPKIKQFYWTTIIVSDVKSYAVLLHYCNGILLVMWKVKQFIGQSYTYVMQKVEQFYWTAAYCMQWHEKIVSFIGLQYVYDVKT